MKKAYLGIDPGQTGAIACITVVDSAVTSVEFYDPAMFQVKSGTKNKSEYNEVDMARALKTFADSADEVTCVLEKVSAMPGQGVTSMFNFGMGFGLWRGMLSAYHIPYSLVHPATWKAKIMKDMPKEKEAAVQRAVQLYPDSASELCHEYRGRTIRHLGRADALLLAHYALTNQ
jgi:crossover junction endodeoxyribonuclease RuvC